jgi:deferrochelatase/peroxidase EfeB
VTHSFVTIAIPFEAAYSDLVEKELDKLGKPLLDDQQEASTTAGPSSPPPAPVAPVQGRADASPLPSQPAASRLPAEDAASPPNGQAMPPPSHAPAVSPLRAKLDNTGIIHFMSITVVRGDDKRNAPPRNGGRAWPQKSFIVIEASVDGSMDNAVETIATGMEQEFLTILRAGNVSARGRSLAAFFEEHRHKVGQRWFCTPGLDYDGTPGMSVERIREEAELADHVADILHDRGPGGTALSVLESVRAKIWAAGDKWAFVAEPAPCLEPKRFGLWMGLTRAFASLWVVLLWPFVLTSLLVGLAFAYWWNGRLSFWEVTLSILGVLVLEIVLVIGLLLYRERKDVPDNIPPKADHVERLMRRETFGAQNHLAASSIMKPGWLRHFTLRAGLWFAAQIGASFSRPSFLGPTRVIHFARWILLPGTNKLLFFSNYDGAWESYLEDFIELATNGVTGIWSNTAGFPRTQGLIFKGAKDGDRLRRWTRRQQHPSLFWYVAYPRLSLARIRTNAAIRQGIANITTEADAADWLSCFGSSPRSADALQLDEIPTLVLGGLRRLRFGTSLFLRLLPVDPKDKTLADKNTEKNKEWLTSIAKDVSYGDHLTAQSAQMVAFSQNGLKKLGLTDQQLATFPVAFQHGNAAPWRARTLGDIGEDNPEKWLWGAGENEVDAVMLLYADDTAKLIAIESERIREIQALRGQVAFRIAFKPLPEQRHGEEAMLREPFGFADGISQPIIRGIRAPRLGHESHLVNPGEFILGYPDNLNYMPPAPAVGPDDDLEGILPSVGADLARQRPEFSTPQPTAQRDLGMNGTFLVVRQLEQDTNQYHDFLNAAAHALQGSGHAPNNLSVPLCKWIAAKMVGRWQDGTSLVRHPYLPGSRPLPGGTNRPDNAFSFRREDPNGLRCPFGAHIRRANPRDSFVGGIEERLDGTLLQEADAKLQHQIKEQMKIVNRHRILRVGRPYEPQNGPHLPEAGLDKPGLVFMCLNTDIERQFEFVQQSWVLGPSFHGLQDEIDPIVGNRRGSEAFSIPTPDGPLWIKDIRDFVRVRGGGYFFLPGKRALRYLAHPKTPHRPAHAAPCTASRRAGRPPSGGTARAFRGQGVGD